MFLGHACLARTDVNSARQNKMLRASVFVVDLQKDYNISSIRMMNVP